jgi:hypothetical protein
MTNRKWSQHNSSPEVYNIKQMKKILNYYKKLEMLENNYQVRIKDKNGNIYLRCLFKERILYLGRYDHSNFVIML